MVNINSLKSVRTHTHAHTHTHTHRGAYIRTNVSDFKRPGAHLVLTNVLFYMCSYQVEKLLYSSKFLYHKFFLKKVLMLSTSCKVIL